MLFHSIIYGATTARYADARFVISSRSSLEQAPVDASGEKRAFNSKTSGKRNVINELIAFFN